MGEIISGKVLSKEVREEVRLEVEALKAQYGAVPHLAVVLVGDDPASQSYVKAKGRACTKAGMKSTIIVKDESLSEAELLSIIEDLNKDREDLSMNSEHMNEIEQNQLKREKIEWERQERLKQQDIDIGIHYRKVNKYMLNN